MQTSHIICLIHSSEPIQRISTDPNAEKILYCAECILESDNLISSNLLTLKQFQESLKELNCIEQKQLKSSNQPPPTSLCEFLQNKEEMISNFDKHITEQKLRAEKKLKNIQEELTTCLENTRKKLISDLDKEYNSYVNKIKIYESKLSQHFNYGEQKIKKMPNFQDFEDVIKKCESALSYEVCIKNYLKVLTDRQQGNTEIEDTKIIAKLQNEAESLQIQEFFPSVFILNEDYSLELENNFEFFKVQIQELSKIANKIDDKEVSSPSIIKRSQLNQVFDQLQLNHKSRMIRRVKITAGESQGEEFRKALSLSKDLVQTKKVLMSFELENEQKRIMYFGTRLQNIHFIYLKSDGIENLIYKNCAIINDYKNQLTAESIHFIALDENSSHFQILLDGIRKQHSNLLKLPKVCFYFEDDGTIETVKTFEIFTIE